MKKLKRDDLVTFYAYLIMRGHTMDEFLKDLNLAVIDYWSMPTLEYIKTKAWKIACQDFKNHPFDYTEIELGQSPLLTKGESINY